MVRKRIISDNEATLVLAKNKLLYGWIVTKKQQDFIESMAEKKIKIKRP